MANNARKRVNLSRAAVPSNAMTLLSSSSRSPSPNLPPSSLSFFSSIYIQESGWILHVARKSEDPPVKRVRHAK